MSCVVRSGPRGRVRWAIRPGGKLVTQDEWNSLEPRMQVRFEVLFERLVTSGEILSQDQFKKLPGTDELWEFKRSNVRILACRARRETILLVVLKKSRQKLSRDDSRRAARICAEDIGGHD